MQYSNPWKRLVAYIIDSFVLSAALQILYSAMAPVYVAVNKDLIAKLTAETASKVKDAPNPELVISLLYSLVPFIVIGIILTTIAYWLYFALMESSSMQATLGKKVFSMIVTDEHGRRISFKTASLRFLVKYFCGFIFLLFLPILFTAKKQTLHDFAAHTIVIDKPQI